MDGITDPTKPYFNKGKWTWDGSEWRRQPFVFGFSGPAGESVQDTNLGAGNSLLHTTAVSAGEVHVVRQVAFKYIGTAPTSLVAYPTNAPATTVVLTEYTVVSDVWYYAQCWLLLEEGDKMTCSVVGATAGDDLYFRYSGYKMSIVE